MEKQFEKNTFEKRLKSMLRVDFKRIFTMPFLYIMLGISFAIPILILVMTTMMDGSVSVNPQTGVETVIEGFDNVWQVIGSTSTANSGAGMDMSLTAMCNINMLYFLIVVLVCIFVADDFRSGYAKNLFTVRAKKTDYVISKTVVGFVGAAAMLVCFFIGALIGGGVAGLPFEMIGFNAGNLLCCMLSKIFISMVFVGVCVLGATIGKQKTWLSILVAFAFSMLFYTMIPMLTPLDCSILNPLLCLVGGVLFSVAMGAISNQVLQKTALV
jgi:hypothetical protein